MGDIHPTPLLPICPAPHQEQGAPSSVSYRFCPRTLRAFCLGSSARVKVLPRSSRLHGTVKTIMGPGYVGVVMEKELGYWIRIKAGLHSHVESFGCESMFVWTHSDIKHSSRFELTRFSIYSPHWAFKPFVLLLRLTPRIRQNRSPNQLSHSHQTQHSHSPLHPSRQRLVLYQSSSASASYTATLSFSQTPLQSHSCLPHPGPVPLFQSLYDKIQAKIVQGMCHRASSTPRTDHRFSAAGYQEDTRLSSNPSCLL
jgi:hypothetical protein